MSTNGLDTRTNRQIERQVKWLLGRWFLSPDLCDRTLLAQQRRPFWWMHKVTVVPPPQSWPVFSKRRPLVIPCACRRCSQQAA